MSESLDPTIQKLLDYGEQAAQDGAAVLQELDPELPFVKCGDLVGQTVIVLDFEERQGPYPEPFYSVRVITKEHELVRVAVGSDAIRKKLDKVVLRLPLRFKIIECESASGMTYFDFE